MISNELILNSNFYELKSRKEKVHFILKKLNLKFDFLNYLEKNNQGKDNPYHNLEHCFTVAICCFKGGCYYSLPLKNIRTIFLAALFHDFNHSGGMLKDNENISLAIAGVENLFIELNKHNDIKLLEKNCLKKIKELIKITEYPFIREPKTLAEKIIRDADLMQYLENDYLLFITGLAKELNIEIDEISTKKFILNQKIYTQWGIETLEPFLNSVKSNTIKKPLFN